MNLPLGINKDIASETAKNTFASEVPRPKLKIVAKPKPLIDRARELKLKSKALAKEVKETVTWQTM